jgi:hypothetical protein
VERAIVGVYITQVNLTFVLRGGLRHTTIVLIIEVNSDPGGREFHGDAGTLEATPQNSDTHYYFPNSVEPLLHALAENAALATVNEYTFMWRCV